MSVTGVSDPDHDRMFKKSFHRRNDSGELDVFEAARYFSGYNIEAAAASSYNCGTTLTQKMMTREDQRQQQPWRSGGRMSLDIPMTMRSSNPLPHHQTHQAVEKQLINNTTNDNKDKKYKQPSSPGGRLASFLNSLFNQTGSKKKKSKSTTQSMKDHEEESPGGRGRRKRRSSISHFRSSSTTTTADTKSFYSSSSSGFRTPPPATKSYREFRSYNNNSDHKQLVASVSKQTTNSSSLQNDRNWVDRYPSEEKEFRKFSEVDDGADSDSSSDLFELQNYDLGIYSSGLPVYETTHMDSITRGAPISNSAL